MKEEPGGASAGGFLVVRPSMDTFREFQSIIRKGDHSGRGGRDLASATSGAGKQSKASSFFTSNTQALHRR